MRNFSIAGLQLELSKGNNLEKLATEVGAAKRRLPWVDMIVLSELSAFGASTADAVPQNSEVEDGFCDVARRNGVWLVPGSHFVRAGDNIYNTALVIDPNGHIAARYRKMFPFYPYEEGVASGDGFCVFEVPEIGRFGVSICYDLWFPEVARTLAFMGAEAIITPSLTNTIDRDVELAMVRATAATNQCYVFNVNGAGDLGFGRSIVCGPGGEVAHQCGSGREIFALELDLDYVARVRQRGWNGLGQTLKSLRDSKASFPPYAPGARSETWDELGALEKPQK